MFDIYYLSGSINNFILSDTKNNQLSLHNVKLSLVVLKLPLLTYSDHKVTFTNPKLTNKVTCS